MLYCIAIGFFELPGLAGGFLYTKTLRTDPEVKICKIAFMKKNAMQMHRVLCSGGAGGI